MLPNPYRTGPPDGEASEPAHPDRELVPAVVVLWVVCFVRTAAGIARGEVFDGMATVAALFAILLPILINSLLRLRRRV
jgi:hypothetical protein